MDVLQATMVISMCIYVMKISINFNRIIGIPFKNVAIQYFITSKLMYKKVEIYKGEARPDHIHLMVISRYT